MGGSGVPCGWLVQRPVGGPPEARASWFPRLGAIYPPPRLHRWRGASASFRVRRLRSPPLCRAEGTRGCGTLVGPNGPISVGRTAPRKPAPPQARLRRGARPCGRMSQARSPSVAPGNHIPSRSARTRDSAEACICVRCPKSAVRARIDESCGSRAGCCLIPLLTAGGFARCSGRNVSSTGWLPKSAANGQAPFGTAFFACTSSPRIANPGMSSSTFFAAEGFSSTNAKLA